MGENHEKTRCADSVCDHVKNSSKCRNLVEFTSAPSINSITTETEKVQEGEESLVGEAHSKGNAIQYNSHVPNDIGNVKVDGELGRSLLITSHQITTLSSIGRIDSQDGDFNQVGRLKNKAITEIHHGYGGDRASVVRSDRVSGES